jgi:hypothetical protein
MTRSGCRYVTADMSMSWLVVLQIPAAAHHRSVIVFDLRLLRRCEH